jgi:acyl-CoA thioesterase-1
MRRVDATLIALIALSIAPWSWGDVRVMTPSPRLPAPRTVLGRSSVKDSRPERATDGDPRTVWDAGKPTVEHPAWLALDLGVGPNRLLLEWSARGSFDYAETDYGSPGSYRVETSADSTDGSDGNWRTVAVVDRVATHQGEHAFDFLRQRWVRFVVTSAPPISPNGVQIDELELHDASRGADDVWFFLGDSITAFAFGRVAPGAAFSACVHARHPAYQPLVIGGGVGGTTSDYGLAHIDELLSRHPDVRYWGVGYGTNDAAGSATDPARFEANMQALVDRIRAGGRVPILATIPYASDGNHPAIVAFNRALDDVRRRNGLRPGPDLYRWFAGHPEQLRDGVHPDDRGIEAINRLWAEAVDGLYPP